MQGIPAQSRTHVLGCSPTLYVQLQKVISCPTSFCTLSGGCSPTRYLQLQKMISCPMSFCILSGPQYFFLGMMEVWVTNGADSLNFSDVIFYSWQTEGNKAQDSGLVVVHSSMWALSCAHRLEFSAPCIHQCCLRSTAPESGRGGSRCPLPLSLASRGVTQPLLQALHHLQGLLLWSDFIYLLWELLKP